MSIMEIKGVRYSYDNKRNVLKNINDVLEKGKIYAILGPSGCGKTTLLSLLGGLDSPTNGAILFDGQDIEKTGLASHRKNNIAFIFQSYNLIDYLTPLENVALTAKLDPKPILERVGLTPEESKRNVQKLSGGQQQRVAIARALASDASVILRDEPTGNLDEDTAAEIIEILKECAHKMGKCVVVVTHSNDFAKQVDVVLAEKGRTSCRRKIVTNTAHDLPHDGKRKKPSYSSHIRIPKRGGFEKSKPPFFLARIQDITSFYQSYGG